MSELLAENIEIEKIVKKGDYLYGICRNHPRASKHGYVLLHRLIVEKHIKRFLNSDEIVHHKNLDKKDNRIENLEVLNSKEHGRLHGNMQGKIICELKCPHCKKIFIRQKCKTFLQNSSKYTCCSKHCRGSFSRKQQILGLTTEIQIAISENLIREFNTLDNV